jgi:hypothetical protein
MKSGGSQILWRLPGFWTIIVRIAHLCCAVFLLAENATSEEKPAASVQPRAGGHAHNDYLHKRPLLDALDHRFISVEADVFLVEGKLLVAHDAKDLRPDRTLVALYLDPLRERAAAHGGWVFEKGCTLTLLIDIKSDAETTYAVLHGVLAGFADMLTTIDDGHRTTKAVTVVISGNRAQETIAAQKRRYAAIDGRLSDLDSTLPAHLLPLVSDNWQMNFKWTGRGPFPETEREKLRSIVKQAHSRGRQVRFWATPENTAVWNELHSAGVDLISTDDLDGLQKFLQDAEREKATPRKDGG